MSALRALITGFGMAGIKDKEAKDNMRMKVAQEMGIDFYKNDVPQHEKEMKLFQKDYDNVAAIYGEDKAKYFANKTGIFGDGKALNTVSNILDKYNLDKEQLKNMDLRSLDEIKAEKNLQFDKKKKSINDLTGIGGIGPKAAELSLEGFGETETAAQELDTTIQTTKETPKVETNISTLFTPKPDERGVESKFENIKKNVVESYGYGESYTTQDGRLEFRLSGAKRNEANAHVALAENFSKNRKDINQIEAATLAKQELDRQVLTPYKIIESSLKNMKYLPGDGQTGKAVLGNISQNIDAATTMVGDVSIYEFITDIYNNDLLQDGSGNVNKAVFDKFVENLPVNIMYEGESLKSVLQNAHAMQYFNRFQ